MQNPRIIFGLLVATVASLMASSARETLAQLSYPMLLGARPGAVEIAKSSEVEVVAFHNLRGANQVLVQGQGISGEVIPPEVPADADPAKLPPLTVLKVRFTVAPEVIPGVYDFKIATPLGVSTVGQLVVVRDPVIAELPPNMAPNNTKETAQAITVPATVCGVIESNEDVDFYKFSATAGQSLSFHVRCMRLEDKLHDFQSRADPLITLRDGNGAVLALVDNYFAGDPLMQHTFAAAGDYFLEVRDVRFQGSPNWYYTIESNPRPLVITSFPLAFAPGVATPLQLVGMNLPADRSSTLTLPADAPDGPRWVVHQTAGGELANSSPVVVTRLPLATETAAPNNQPDQAQPLAVPAGINGRVESEADVDCYAFEAKAGETFTFELHARRRQSGLDPIMRIIRADGATLIENDDMQTGRFIYQDARIEHWAAPADGKYVLEVRDLHLRGGETFVYFLQAERSGPYYSLELDTDKTIVNPGNGGVFYVRAYRKNGFAGEISLAVEGIPPGVTASCGRILENGQDGCIILTAAPDAPLGVADIRVTGSAMHKLPDGSMLALTTVARPLQEYYSPGGGRGNFPVETHTVSVNPPLDIKSVKVNVNEINLKPGEKQKIEITIERREGFEGNVTLDCIFQHLGQRFGDSLPKGVSVVDNESKTLLTKGENAGAITLIAAADASPVERQQIAVMANVSINFVMKMTHAAQPVFVTVGPK